MNIIYIYIYNYFFLNKLELIELILMMHNVITIVMFDNTERPLPLPVQLLTESIVLLNFKLRLIFNQVIIITITTIISGINLIT